MAGTVVQLAAGERLILRAPALGSVDVWMAPSGADMKRLDRYRGSVTIGPYRYEVALQIETEGGTGDYTVLAPNGTVSSGPTSLSESLLDLSGGSTTGSVVRAQIGGGLQASGIQWLRDGVAISGATGQTYTRVEADEGKVISYSLTLGAVVAGGQWGRRPPPVGGNPSTLAAFVLGFGDSTMYGMDGNSARVAANLRALDIFAASRGMPVRNNAISGTVLQNTADTNGQPRTDNGFGRYQTATLGANSSRVVVSNYGLNDLRWSRQVLATFIARYTTIVRDWKSAGCEVILASPAWMPDAGYNAGSAGFTGTTRTIHEDYVAAVWQLAKDENVKYAPAYERMKAIGATTVGADNIHPTVLGYATMAQAYIDAAVPMEASWPGAAAAPTPAPPAPTPPPPAPTPPAPAPSPNAAAPVTLAATNASWREVSAEKYDSNTGTTSFDAIAQVAGTVTVGTAAWVELQFGATDAGGVVVLDPSSTLSTFLPGANRAFLMQLINDGRVFQSINNTVSAAMSPAFTFAGFTATSRVRLHIDAAGQVSVQTTTDDGANWTKRMDLGTPVAAGTVLYFKLYNTNQRKMYQPRQSGVN